MLNDDYSKAGIKFNHADTSRTVNARWAYDEAEMPMKRKLRKGSYHDLNVYYITEPEKNALGYSTYPLGNVKKDSDEYYEDGCVILASTVPGGSEEGYNL
ncbi:zinc metalloprotease, partial [Candidatus Bathyarchaeota archaeon]|nr:zinc metalloprotease [Candidatus Bathyarchaeota archaeon]